MYKAKKMPSHLPSSVNGSKVKSPVIATDKDDFSQRRLDPSDPPPDESEFSTFFPFGKGTSDWD